MALTMYNCSKYSIVYCVKFTGEKRHGKTRNCLVKMETVVEDLQNGRWYKNPKIWLIFSTNA